MHIGFLQLAYANAGIGDAYAGFGDLNFRGVHESKSI